MLELFLLHFRDVPVYYGTVVPDSSHKVHIYYLL